MIRVQKDRPRRDSLCLTYDAIGSCPPFSVFRSRRQCFCLPRISVYRSRLSPIPFAFLHPISLSAYTFTQVTQRNVCLTAPYERNGVHLCRFIINFQHMAIHFHPDIRHAAGIHRIGWSRSCGFRWCSWFNRRRCNFFCKFVTILRLDHFKFKFFPKKIQDRPKSRANLAYPSAVNPS